MIKLDSSTGFRQVASRLPLALPALLVLCLSGANAWASSYTVSIDTTALFGTSAQLAFDLIDGGTPANSVTISAFTTNGTLGSASTAGGVSGSLGTTVILNDSSPQLNEYLANISLGNHLSFAFEATQNAPDDPNSSPDGFSFYLLNAQGQTITSTGDPTGSNALLVLDITGGASEPTPYTGTSPSVPVSVTPTAVPIPGGFVLFLSGLLAIMGRLKFSANRADGL